MSDLDMDPLAGELDKAREVLAEAGALRSDSSPHILPSLRALIAERDRLLGELEQERTASEQDIAACDNYHDLLDLFALSIAPVEVIGEHSTGNDPWANALDLVTPAAEVEKLRNQATALQAERASAYSALSEQGRSAADVSGNLEDGVNWDQLAHSAEVSGLVEELAAVRGERDRLAEAIRVRGITHADEVRAAAYEAMDAERRSWESRRSIENVHLSDLRRDRDGLAERVREEIAATRAYAKQFESLANDSRAAGNPTRAQRQQCVADELTDRADRFERALNGGEPDAG